MDGGLSGMMVVGGGEGDELEASIECGKFDKVWDGEDREVVEGEE